MGFNWSDIITAISAVLAVGIAVWTLLKNKSDVFKNTSSSASELSEGVTHIIKPLNDRIHYLEELVLTDKEVRLKTLAALKKLGAILDEIIKELED